LGANGGNEREPLEIRSIESQQVGEIMHAHCRDQPSIMSLLSKNLVLRNQSLPFFKAAIGVWRQGEKRLDVSYLLSGFYDRES
jgi:hypothetical protein